MTQQEELFDDKEEATPGVGFDSAEERIDSLDRNSKDILFILAIRGKAQSKSSLSSALNRTILKSQTNRNFTGDNGSVAIRKLREAGLVFNVAQGWSMDYEIESFAIGKLCDDPEYSNRAEAIMQSIWQELVTSRSPYFYRIESDDDCLARIAYYLNDYASLERLVFPEESWAQGASMSFVAFYFDQKRINLLPPSLKRTARYEGLRYCINYTVRPEKFMGKLYHEGNDYSFLQMAGEEALLRGDFKTVKEWARRYAEWGSGLSQDHQEWKISSIADPISWEASMEFLKGNVEGSISLFERCISTLKGKSRKKKFTPRGWPGFFYQIALMARGNPGDLQRAIQIGNWGLELAETTSVSGFTLGNAMAECLLGREQYAIDFSERNEELFQSAEFLNVNSLLVALLARLCHYSDKQRVQWRKAADSLSEQCASRGFTWLAYEYKALFVAWQDKPTKADEERLVQLRKALSFTPGKSLVEWLTPVEQWEMRLTAIEEVARKHAPTAKKKTAKKKTAARKEVIWIIAGYGDRYYSPYGLHPVLRSVSAAGKPAKGRNIALKKLKESPDDIPELTEQDHKVASHIKISNKWGTRINYGFEDSRALIALAGHPLVFKEDLDTGERIPVKLSSGRFQIDVSETKKGGLKAVLKPHFDPSDAYGMLVEENPGELTIYEITPEIEAFRDALGGSDDITLPAKAKDRFITAVSSLAEKIDIAADGELTKGLTATASGNESDLISMEGDPRPRLRLFPDGNGLSAQLVVQPIESCEHRFNPGEGRDTIFGISKGKRTQAKRDLKTETQSAQWLIDNCPSLAMKRGELRDLWSWQFEDPQSCLELLRDLAELPEENNRSIVEWPEDQPFKLHGIISAGNFGGSLGSASDWLTVSGDFRVNDEMVLSMRQLLDATGTQAGFLELNKGEYIALTDRFARQLEDLRALAHPGKADKIKLPPLAALALEDFVEEVDTKSKNKAWQEWIDRIKDAQNYFPDPPANLQAELRSYQLEGYRWLSRLAKCGGGACLADDMGLGKTVQTLSLLLERAEGGPALVIAPTSVAANWFDECLKFAPTLNTIVFGNGDRAKQLASAKPFDLVICTYGLLQRESDALSEVQWHTVVLDEAQAIKNSSTQRSKAAKNLNADFRIVTTGTPVENRLSELHTLFQFILPGYLGGWEKFRKTFADPIEKDQDAAARDRLRRLIQPFMLRRLKSSVLRDLPSRTEVNINVELSDKETAFYEALRQKAMEGLEGDTVDTPGQKTFQILAELTRLRRACCHPVLIDKKNGAKLNSSKLEAFSDTVSDIIAGNHKVLVFSQFVDHLSLIRKELDRKKITYQYLDGSTSKPKRKAAVDAFQRGESDAFLISLKAGGFGLNLTAADYVIHMDPWWNPAAEDQASDRAHRIGQTRPVTIYRFITKDTIEEKIVALHHQKRELAESLLSGTDVADTKLSPEELMKLLKDG
ncbi:MAG: DEAD/DEAH box helicase [Verrucomicrobiales bacterium]|nr:DEAD/DEAH box helicase [Verrucomicrobiales bacterium]